MKTKAKILLNTLSVALLLLSSILFASYFLYTRDLKGRILVLHREMAKFMLTLIDERLTALQMGEEVRGAEGEGAGPENSVVTVARESALYRDIVESVVDYFDLEGSADILVFDSQTGDVLYQTRGGRTMPIEVRTLTAEHPEGELTLSDRFGYFVRYGEPGIGIFVFSRASDAFSGRNMLLYALFGLVLFFTLLMILLESGSLGKWQRFTQGLGEKLKDVIRSSRNVPEKLDERPGGETGRLAEQYNSMVERVNSVFRDSEERIRSLFQQRDNLKKLVYLYKKYIPDEVLLRLREDEVTEWVSRRLSVASLHIELVDFLEPTDLLYPQVITDELNDFHLYIKGLLRERSGIINFSKGYSVNVIYGVPLSSTQSFVNALEGAKQIVNWIEERNSAGRNRSGVRWSVKMGLAHGSAVTGIVGESYIVLGDAVERAQEMLAHAKYFGVPLVADSIDCTLSSPDIKYRTLDVVRSTGNGTASERRLYELFLQEPRMVEQAVKIYGHGLRMFYEKRYDIAVVDFKKVNAIFDGDGPSQIFLRRCERMIRGKRVG